MRNEDANPRDTENQKPAPLDAGWREKLQGRRVARAIPRLTDRSSLPLSFEQERLWLLEQLEPGNPAYNRPLALRLTGTLNQTALRQALEAIIDRHEVLRARYPPHDGLPMQIISPSLALDLRVIELSQLPPTERQSRARSLATQEALRPFDLAKGPIWRVTLLRLGELDHVLLLIFHHIVFDAWSAQVMVGEFADLYRALTTGTSPSLPELPIQYGDFAHWQRQRLGGELLERQLGNWKSQLSGCVPLDLPTDRPRPSILSNRGGCTEIFLPEPLADSLRALGRHENATLFMVLLTAFKALLARYTGGEDIAVGTPVAGRNWVETEKLIGIFINILVLRSDLAGNPTFHELLARVRETCRSAYGHQDIPFAKLVEALRPERDLSTTPLFQVMFNLENLPTPENELPGLRMEEFEFEVPLAACDLTLEILPRGRELKCSLVYNADLFDQGTIERMAVHYRTLLEAIVAEPDGHIASLPLLTPSERRQILVEWNRTDVEYPRDSTLQELFEAQAQRRPEAVALTLAGQHLTYEALNRQANRLAHQLRGWGVGCETRVGLLVERSLDMVVGLLAILKAGGACVPLDPAYPQERLAFMLEDAGIHVLLTQERLRHALPKGALRVVCLERGEDADPGSDHHNPRIGAKPDHVAYVLYTSGSTGKPKGVEVLHRGIVRLVCGTDYIRFGPDQVFLQYCSISFDLSTFEIWGSLLHGGRCVLIPQRVPDLAQLRAVLQSEKVTTMIITPSFFNTVIDTAPEILAPVRQVLVAGEALSVPHIGRALSLLPNSDLVNAYGPTEASTLACCYRIPRSQNLMASSIPIGRPIANTHVYILDRHLQPVPVGVAGELYVGGDGLARGYLNRPQITCQRFIPDPLASQPGARLYQTGDLCRYLPDGNIEFLGRLDHQVKIRGFRIELGEIETILAQHPAVSAAAVVVREEIPGNKRLVAYTVPRHLANPPTPKVLRDFLRERLPEYMVPSDIVMLEALPLTPNGKLDRRALPTGSRSTHAGKRYAPPRDLPESQLVRIWEEILNVRPIGIEDDFFDLGGHSLLAMRMMGRIEDAYGKGLSLATLFAKATVAHLAECLRMESLSEVESPIVPVQPEGSCPPFFFLHGGVGLYCRKLARLLGPEQPFYGMVARNDPALTTVEAIAEDTIRQLVALHPHGPYLLGGFCHGGLIAYEMARQMEQQGLEVGMVILLDAWVPRYFGWLKALIRCGGGLARLDVDAQTYLYGRLRAFLVRAANAHHEGLRTFLKSCLRAAKTDLLRLPGTPPEAPGLPGPAFNEPEAPLADLRYRGILMNYRPKPYPGRVVSLRTKSAEIIYPADRTSGWGKLAPQVEVHELPGDHITCQTEHIGDVAEHMGRCLRAYHADAPGAWAQNRSL